MNSIAVLLEMQRYRSVRIRESLRGTKLPSNNTQESNPRATTVIRSACGQLDHGSARVDHALQLYLFEMSDLFTIHAVDSIAHGSLAVSEPILGGLDHGIVSKGRWRCSGAYHSDVSAHKRKWRLCTSMPQQRGLVFASRLLLRRRRSLEKSTFLHVIWLRQRRHSFCQLQSNLLRVHHNRPNSPNKTASFRSPDKSQQAADCDHFLHRCGAAMEVQCLR